MTICSTCATQDLNQNLTFDLKDATKVRFPDQVINASPVLTSLNEYAKKTNDKTKNYSFKHFSSAQFNDLLTKQGSCVALGIANTWHLCEPMRFCIASPSAAATPAATPVATPVAATPQATPVASPAATPQEAPIVAVNSTLDAIINSQLLYTTSSGTLQATPAATPPATPQATPAATPQATPTATPVATPQATPAATPAATPTATPVATPVATPQAKSAVTPAATPEGFSSLSMASTCLGHPSALFPSDGPCSQELPSLVPSQCPTERRLARLEEQVKRLQQPVDRTGATAQAFDILFRQYMCLIEKAAFRGVSTKNEIVYRTWRSIIWASCTEDQIADVMRQLPFQNLEAIVNQFKFVEQNTSFFDLGNLRL